MSSLKEREQNSTSGSCSEFESLRSDERSILKSTMLSSAAVHAAVHPQYNARAWMTTEWVVVRAALTPPSPPQEIFLNFKVQKQLKSCIFGFLFRTIGQLDRQHLSYDNFPY